ncbi:hypothetical protein M427DRAFT_53879 [Gonapodya prolifera JEL478]|uniref:Uncharacterized protein n=1 Tax=Gonapodya prolifera (strain JEL478) TaxID=1344416 RepID=A0A139APD2_GONPJ|nr:hypothetical protein M427DRAFT_53879 [Gonapodya prolifera JEL478]|eukprot:KXS18504.1 hypothetical protein M427DRAFT_53879 [Gonapodya prolifera JEL478]
MAKELGRDSAAYSTFKMGIGVAETWVQDAEKKVQMKDEVIKAKDEALEAKNKALESQDRELASFGVEKTLRSMFLEPSHSPEPTRTFCAQGTRWTSGVLMERFEEKEFETYTGTRTQQWQAYLAAEESSKELGLKDNECHP